MDKYPHKLQLLLQKLGHMNEKSLEKLDIFDFAILRALQNDASLSQRDLAEKIGLSQNACWRRYKRLKGEKIIIGQNVRVDPKKLGLNLTVFIMVRTRHHSKEWLKTFRESILSIENVIDFYRIAGDFDYMLKIVAADMNGFDEVYQRLISKVELDAVTSYVTMEAIADNRTLPI